MLPVIESLNDFVSNTGYIVFLSLSIPIVATIVSAFSRNAFFRDTINILLSLLLFFYLTSLNLNLLQNFFEKGVKLGATMLQIAPGIELKFTIEPFGIAFSMMVAFLWLITNIYSSTFMYRNGYKNLNRFNSFFAASIFAVMGLSLSGNMFTLFIFYELLTLVTYPLVAHTGDEKAREAGKKYLLYLMLTSLLLFVAIVWVWSLTGTTDFAAGGVLAGKVSPVILSVLLFLVVYGVGKAAIMPLHGWLVSAMVAPIPVSALLHAVAVVKAGVFVIVKIIMDTFGLEFLSQNVSPILLGGNWLTIIAGLTIIFASSLAVKQDEIKKMLAFSTISNLSYVVLAASIFNGSAIIGAVLHLIGHSFAKISLFYGAGAIYTRTHKTRISEISGLGKKMPFTFSCFSIGAASLIGLPFTVGFVSKFFILIGALEAQNFAAVIFIAGGTLLSCFYFLQPIYKAFFGETKEEIPSKNYIFEAPLPMLIAMGVVALTVILMFLFANKLTSYIALLT